MFNRYERPSVIDGTDFDPDDLRGNEVNVGDINHYVTWAKIPNLPGRISRKKNENGMPYIELILDRTYDKEKQQCRNRRVTIGSDISAMYRGMMIPNQTYYRYFDHDGHPLFSKDFPETMPDDKEPELIKKRPVTSAEPETTETADTQTAEETKEATAAATKGIQTASETQTTTQTTETAAEQTTGLATPAVPVLPAASVEPALTPEQEAEIIRRDLEARKRIQENKRKEDRIKFLKSLLQMYQYSITVIAEKKPYMPLSDYQIRRINMLLREIQELFRDYENSEYLQLADEAEDNADMEAQGNSSGETAKNESGEKKLRMTYGDMAILLAPYEHFFNAQLFGRLWYR